MAKSYYAINQIRFGVEGQKEPTIFEAGEQVTGLPKEAMVQLWEAGVLREHDPSKVEPDERDIRITQLEAEIEALKAEKASAAQTPREPEDVPGQGDSPTPNTPEAAADMVGTSADPADEGTTDGSTTT
jgi:hypothetical protein